MERLVIRDLAQAERCVNKRHVSVTLGWKKLLRRSGAGFWVWFLVFLYCFPPPPYFVIPLLIATCLGGFLSEETTIFW